MFHSMGMDIEEKGLKLSITEVGKEGPSKGDSVMQLLWRRKFKNAAKEKKRVLLPASKR